MVAVAHSSSSIDQEGPERAIGRALVLNSDYSLLSVSSTWYHGWRLIYQEKAFSLADYATIARTSGPSFNIPAVVVLKKHVRLGRRRQSFSLPSKRNILVREGFKCAYCSNVLTLGSVTRDHVHPQSRGGKDELSNVVAACGSCNNKKGARTPSEAKMPLRSQPRPLTDDEKIAVLVKTHGQHERKAWAACLKENNLTLF